MTKRKVAPKIRPRTAERNARTEIDARPDAARGANVAFESRTAFDNVVHDLRDVEALAVAADSALEALPFFNTERQRRAVGRLYALVTTTAATATAALDQAVETQARLDGVVERTDDDPPADEGRSP